jgi:hypothetical protein
MNVLIAVLLFDSCLAAYIYSTIDIAASQVNDITTAAMAISGGGALVFVSRLTKNS